MCFRDQKHIRFYIPANIPVQEHDQFVYQSHPHFMDEKAN